MNIFAEARPLCVKLDGKLTDGMKNETVATWC